MWSDSLQYKPFSVVTRVMRKFLLSISVCISVLFSQAAAAELVVTDARIKQVLPGRTTTAGYMTVRNTSKKPVLLLGATLPQASSIEMHEMINSEGLSGMRQRPQVAIPAGKSVAFKTGGLHLMVFGVQQPLADEVDIRLHFDDDTEQTVRFATEAW